MEADPDSSVERPLRKRIPLEPARTAELLESVARAKEEAEEKLHEQHEELHASRYSMPAKVLAWLMIGSWAFDFSADYFGYQPQLAGIVALFVGLSVLRGAKSALRIAAFMFVTLSTILIVEIAWTGFHRYPFDSGKKWVAMGSWQFFAFIAAPCAYLVAEAVLAVTAIRLRNLTFWTRPVKFCASIVAGLLLVQLGLATRAHLQDEKIHETFATELAEARKLIPGGGSPATLKAPFTASPNVLRIHWAGENGYQRDVIFQSPPRSPSRDEKLYEYWEWIKTPAGDWGKLKLDVVLPKKP